MKKYDIKDLFIGEVYYVKYDEYNYISSLQSINQFVAFKRVRKEGKYLGVFVAEDVINGHYYPIAGFDRLDYEKIENYCPMNYIIGKYMALSTFAKDIYMPKVKRDDLVELLKKINNPQEEKESALENVEPVNDSFLNLLLKSKEKIALSNFSEDAKKDLMQELLTMADNYYNDMLKNLNSEGITLSTRNIEYEYIQKLAAFELRTFNPQQNRMQVLTRDLTNFKNKFKL